MKTINKILVLFLISLITISSLSSLSGFARFAKGWGISYDIELTTINGVSPGDGPFVNPVTIAGSASGQNFEGQLSQYQVEVVWGDGTKAVTSTVHFTQDDNDFSGTWASNPHTYAQPGTYTLTMRLYHAQPPGSDGSADAVDTVNCVMSSITTLTLSKNSPQTAGTSLTATATVFPSAATGSVQFQVKIPGSSTWSTFDTETLSSGLATSKSYVLSNVGVYNFQAVYSGDCRYTGSKSSTISLMVNPATTVSFAVSGFPSPTIAAVAHSVTVTAKDQYGNVATAFSGTVTITSSDLAATLPPTGSLTNGVGSFSVTLKTSGTQSITATSGSVSGSQVGIQVNAASATHLVVSAPGSVNVGASFSVTVTALDAYNNLATGYSGTVHFTSSSAGTLPADSTLSSGSKTLLGVILTTAGSQTLTATDTVTSSITGYTTITVNPVPGSWKLVFTAGAGQSLYAGQVSNVVTVQLRDQYGNPVTSGVTVGLFSTSSGGKFFSDSAGAHQITSVSISSGSSMGSFYYSDTVADSPTLTASSMGVTSATTMFTITSSGVTQFNVVASPTTVTAGGSVTVTVKAEDAHGNIVASYSGTVHFSSTDGQATLPANSGLASGVGSFSVTLKTVGSQTVTATDTVSSTITGTSNSVTVSAGGSGAAVNFVVSASPSSITAGDTVKVSVTAKDAFDNTVPAYGGTVHFTSSDAQATLPADSTLTNGAGSFSITLKTAGTQTVTATDTVSSSITGTSGPIFVSVAAGGAIHFEVYTPVFAVAGSAFSVTVAAVDQFSNVVTFYSGTVHFTSTDGQAVLPTDGGLTNGVGSFSVTLKTVGSQTITATDTLTASITGTSNAVIVIFPAGSPTHFVVSTPSIVAAGASFNVNVTAVDQFGNRVTGYPGTIHFYSTSAGTLPVDSVLPAGTGVFNITLTIAGSQNVIVTDTVDPTISGLATLMINGYTVTFIENGLATGTVWNVTFGGTLYSSTTNKITINNVSAISYAWSTSPYVQLSQIKYAVNQTLGSINVPSQLTQSVTYQTQYLVTYTTNGNVLPVTVPLSEWVNSGGLATGVFPAQVVNSQGNTRVNFITDNRTSITQPTTILATYKTQYYLTITSQYGIPSGQGWYDAGSVANIGLSQTTVGGTSTRNVFTTWTGSGSGSYTGPTTSQSITMSGPITEIASWTTQNLVTYAATGNAIAVTLPPSEWVNYGSPATATFPLAVANQADDTHCILKNDDRPSSIKQPTTITADYQTQFKVTFNQSGIESDVKGTILSIFGSPENYSQLPTAMWVNNGAAVSFTFANNIPSTVSNKVYTLTGTNATSPITIDMPTLIQGEYKPQFSSSLFTVAIFFLIILLLLAILLLLMEYRRRRKKKQGEVIAKPSTAPTTP